MRRPRRREAEQVTFDFAPMVDIVLLLVIFFMLTSQLMSQDRTVPLDLPTASSSVKDASRIPTISIQQNGAIFLEGKQVTLQQLQDRVKGAVKGSGGIVALRADKNSNYGVVVSVMDTIRKVGTVKIALATEEK
ncbi:ExbD/TolR family protein [Deinococcus cellulosilyticus]|uniref:Biopolymer transporter ExbD n=1 Tax=Deinococcus cellulosilyticus (strain DSM 18568 / NBRC 106333 / KACC 11606 / 5516J-15) TaxID=1223518 RepID=A0A511MVG1_DEIC1|nr:biopolymer transporter ExbD [Deinococcus cellulosilyticus]GEM44563.1 biopolymer transporter ExbD [Deinococcus cellulosilyticus NBRC 106333 = KACC 11606]